MKYLTNSGLSYFLNKIKAYLTSSTYLNSIGISNSEIDNIADDAGYSSGSLPASEDIFITGDIIPNTDNSVDLGASSKNFKMVYTKGITINGTQFLPSDYIPRSGLSTVATSGSYNDLSNKPTIPTKTSDLTNDSGFLTSHQDLSGYVPRSGGAVIRGNTLGRIDGNGLLFLNSGNTENNGGHIVLFGASYSWGSGAVRLNPASSSTTYKFMYLYPNGSWTWEGTAVQLISDQRLKQQIAEIDDKLLDAWEDVDLVQFKYNDAVDQKGKDKARLHTGYVVQQIDNACKSHNVDISAYGLYCHEEYPEETEEVEVEQEDGTKVKERKVIREASEHYSLRYTETLVVECAYLRKRIKELEERLEKLEDK